MARQLQPCGTRAAYERHRRRREFIDEACTEANRTHQAEWRAAAALADARVVPHGLNGHDNYACRCEVCVAAKAQVNRERPSRSKRAAA